jgi:hypothetical protein
LQWLQNPYQINEDNLKNKMLNEQTFWENNSKYFKGKISGLETKRKNRKI